MKKETDLINMLNTLSGYIASPMVRKMYSATGSNDTAITLYYTLNNLYEKECFAEAYSVFNVLMAVLQLSFPIDVNTVISTDEEKEIFICELLEDFHDILSELTEVDLEV